MTIQETNGNERAVGPPPLPANYGRPLEPVKSGERVVSVDVLRGFALLGILIANMIHFSEPLNYSGFRNGLWLGPLDKVADWFCVLFVEGKFYPLFSMLFGFGFAVQMDRGVARGLDPTAAFRRRLFILAGFGFAHGIFLWEGDVLLAYALCGFLLLPFRKAKPRTTLIWAGVLILLPALLCLFFGLVFSLLSGTPDFEKEFKGALLDDPETKAGLMGAYVTGGYPDAVFYRCGELIFTTLTTMVFAPAFLGLFLIGMLAGRKGMIADVGAHRKSLVRILVVGGVIGLAGNFIGAWAIMGGSASQNYGTMLLGMGIVSIFGPVLTAAYGAGIVLLHHRKPGLALFSPIASVGRMALSNYLAQSLIATTVFYGYGLGLGGEVGRLGTVGIALVIFAAQILFSMAWLRFFRFGPMEWLWRSLTYGKRQTMLR